MMGRRQRVLVATGPVGHVRAAPRTGSGDLAAFDPQVPGDWWWRQPRRLHRAWRLDAGGRTLATLAASGPFGRTIRATFAEGTYELRRRLGGGIDVHREGEAVPELRLVAHFFGGGHLESESGGRLEVKRTGFFRPGFEVQTPEGHVLLRARPRHGFLRFEAALALEDAGRRRPDLAGLVAVMGVLATTPPRHAHG